MDRNEYLNLAMATSRLEDGVMGIKVNVPITYQVEINQTYYYPVAYEMKFENGQVLHKAILHDLKANSILYAPLDEIRKRGD